MSRQKVARLARDNRRAALAGGAMLATAARYGEMLEAAGRTIGLRGDLLRQAAADPLSGDYVEFARMGQEKLEAASLGGQAMVAGWQAAAQVLATAWQRQVQAGTTAALAISTSRTPAQAQAAQSAFLQGSVERSSAAALRLAELGGRTLAAALDPYHSRTAGNARRLARAAGGSRRKIAGR